MSAGIQLQRRGFRAHRHPPHPSLSSAPSSAFDGGAGGRLHRSVSPQSAARTRRCAHAFSHAYLPLSFPRLARSPALRLSGCRRQPDATQRRLRRYQGVLAPRRGITQPAGLPLEFQHGNRLPHRRSDGRGDAAAARCAGNPTSSTPSARRSPSAEISRRSSQ